MKSFPIYSLKRLCKEAGAKRVSKDFLEELRNILIEEVERIAKISKEFMSHSKRKTLLKRDIELAIK